MKIILTNKSRGYEGVIYGVTQIKFQSNNIVRIHVGEFIYKVKFNEIESIEESKDEKPIPPQRIVVKEGFF